MSPALNTLFELLHQDRVSSLETTVDMQAWGRALIETLADLAPGEINQTNREGRTPLGALVACRDVWNAVAQSATTALLGAGANPLAGEHPAWRLGNPFTSNPAMLLMLEALVNAEQAGKPFLDEQGGNALHVFAEGNAGSFMSLASGSSPLAEHIPASVFAAWRDQERSSDGLRPVTLAWLQDVPQSSRDGMQVALWSLLRTGSKGPWTPPDLAAVDGSGQPLWAIVEDKVRTGAVDGFPGLKAWESVQALSQQHQLDTATAGIQPRAAARQGMKRL